MTDTDILVVEDNHGDVNLIERAFESRALPGTLHVVQTGDEALDWVLRPADGSAGPRLPDLVLLDLNLPSTSGLDVLEQLKSESPTKRVPVVVLTSSQSPDDIQEAYDGAANACMIKPVDPDEFADHLEAFAGFWLSTAELPVGPEHPSG